MRMALFTRFTKCLEGGILHVVDLDLRAVDPSQARSKQILTGQARKWAGQRGVSGSNYIASLKIQNYQVMSSLLTRQPV